MRAFGSRPADAFQFDDVIYEKRDRVATITINRPGSYNCYTTRSLEELATAFRDAAFDDAIGVIVYTGAGNAAFCTGGDVKEYEAEYTARPRDYWKYMQLFRAYIESIVNSGKPVIARINGMAVGGGNESQMACDLAIMADHAWLGQVGTRVGSVAAGGATQWLPLHVGDRRAREMLFLNGRIPSQQALEWGLVNRVVPTVRTQDGFLERANAQQIKLALQQQQGFYIDFTKLDEAVRDMAERLLEHFPECTRYTKQQVNFWKELSWHQTVGHAADWLSLHFGSAEPFEGMRAFVEKRPVRYAELRERAASGGSSEYVWGAHTRSCSHCGTSGLPELFTHCGVCGEAIAAPAEIGSRT